MFDAIKPDTTLQQRVGNNSIVMVSHSGTTGNSTLVQHLDRGLFIAFLVLLLWLPVPFGSNRPWAWALMEVWSFVATGFWLVLNIISPRLYTVRHYLPLLVLFGLFVIWSGLQQVPLPIELVQFIAPANAQSYLSVDTEIKFITLSLDANQTHISFIKGLSYWCILFLMTALANTPHRLKILIYTAVISGTLQACYGVLLALSGSKTTWFMGFPNPNFATGSFIYRNHFGNFLVICLCLGIGFLVGSLSNTGSRSLKARILNSLATLLNGKAALRLCLAIMVVGLVMSHARMANAAFFVSLCIAGLLGLWLIRNKNRSLTILLASLMVIDLSILGSWFGMDELKQRLENTSLANEERVYVNQYGITLISQYPLTGTGGGSFYSSFPSVKGPEIHKFYDQAHNDYLQFAQEYGVPSLLVLAMAVLCSLYYGIMALKLRRSRLMQGVAFASVMAIISELIQLSTDFHLQAPATAIYFMLCLVLAWKARFMPTRPLPTAEQPTQVLHTGITNIQKQAIE